MTFRYTQSATTTQGKEYDLCYFKNDEMCEDNVSDDDDSDESDVTDDETTKGNLFGLSCVFSIRYCSRSM